MRKFLTTFFCFILIFTSTFAISNFINTYHVNAQGMGAGPVGLGNGGAPASSTINVDRSQYDNSPGFWERNVIRPFLTYASFTAMKFMSFLLGVSGVLLNYVLNISVVQMAKDFNSDVGIGAAINSAWTTVRDVANMSFIFVLLYASIQLILGLKGSGDVRNLIVKVIVAALLINFSLFGTKVIIDASNVIALTFYEAVSPGAANATASWTTGVQTGLSDSLMDPLRLSSLMAIKDGTIVSTGGILTLGIMGSLMLLVATFIFLVISVLFIIRYVILIFVLILSPLALIADIVPGVKSYFNKWKDALINQSFFPAIYFFFTWITIKLLRGLVSGLTTPFPQVGDVLSKAGNVGQTGTSIIAANYSVGVGSIMVNFLIVIAFLITSLIAAKQMAAKAAPGVDGLVKWASGKAGAATFGFAGAAARNTVGRVGQAISESETLKKKDAQGGFGSMAARLTLAAGRKTASQNFDIRGTTVGSQLGTGKAQKGGYAQTVKDRAKAQEERAKYLKPSDQVIADAERELNLAKEAQGKLGKNASEQEKKAVQDRIDKAQGRVSDLKGNKDDVEANIKKQKDSLEKERRNNSERKDAEQQIDAEKSNRKSLQDRANSLELEIKDAVGEEKIKKERDLANTRELLNESTEKIKAAQKKIDKIDEDYENRKSEIEERGKKAIIASAQDRRRDAAAAAAETSTTSKVVSAVLGSNTQGFRGALRRSLTHSDLTTASKMRDKKKSVKQLVDEAMTASGEKPEEPKEEKPEDSTGEATSGEPKTK